MNDFRFILDRSNKKFFCPQCQKKRFVRYFDIERKEYLPDEFGRCDRESKCSYFLNPYTDGYVKELLKQEKESENGITKITKITKITSQKKHFFEQPHQTISEKPVFFHFETFRKTLQKYEDNVFIQNLLSRVKFPFPADEVKKLIQLYRLGTVSAGAISFPFIDVAGNVRAIQVKWFDEQNHTTKTSFLHSIIEMNLKEKKQPLPKWLEDYSQQEKKVSCLFGEHLLNDFPSSTVALVEAPKTAIYCSFYLQKYDWIWLAVYNKSSFSFDKLKVLQGRNVLIFPDLSKDGSTFREWKTKAEDYERKLSGTQFTVSTLLEDFAPPEDRENGNDIADFLIEQDWRNFQEATQKQLKKYEDYTKEERLVFGLNCFPTSELMELAKEMFSGKEKLSVYEIKEFLSDGLQGNDIEDLLDILCIKKILKATDFPNYELIKIKYGNEKRFTKVYRN